MSFGTNIILYGIDGQMQSWYHNVQYCVCLNGVKSNFVQVKCGKDVFYHCCLLACLIQIQIQITLFYIKLQIKNTRTRLFFDVYTKHVQVYLKHYILYIDICCPS